jgi:hypothetical protein
MRAAGARKEMEKAIDTSTTRWKKINFPKGMPPTSEGLRAFQDHTWKDKKRWLEYILKKHQDTHPLPTESYTPIVPAHQKNIPLLNMMTHHVYMIIFNT